MKLHQRAGLILFLLGLGLALADYVQFIITEENLSIGTGIFILIFLSFGAILFLTGEE